MSALPAYQSQLGFAGRSLHAIAAPPCSGCELSTPRTCILVAGRGRAGLPTEFQLVGPASHRLAPEDVPPACAHPHHSLLRSLFGFLWVKVRTPQGARKRISPGWGVDFLTEQW